MPRSFGNTHLKANHRSAEEQFVRTRRTSNTLLPSQRGWVFIPLIVLALVIAVGNVALVRLPSSQVGSARPWVAGSVLLCVVGLGLCTALYAKSLQRLDRFFAALLRDGNEVVLVVKDGVVTHAAGATNEVLGAPSASLVGSPITSFAPDEQARISTLVRLGATKPGECVRGGTFEWTTSHGGVRFIELRLSNHRADRGIRADLLTITDRTSEHELEQRLARASAADPSTNLPNSLRFRELLNVAVHRARRTGEHLAVLSVVVDEADQLREAYGQEATEALFNQVAVRLGSALRIEDSIGRISPNEFGVVLAGLAAKIGRAYAVDVADRITAGVATPFFVEGKQLSVRVSIGIAHRAKGIADPTAAELMSEAHTAMLEVRANAARWGDLHPA
jgi:diguanylate cyclase (GGDEF)-like protein/PAS domain S-box-containing protein